MKCLKAIPTPVLCLLADKSEYPYQLFMHCNGLGKD